MNNEKPLSDRERRKAARQRRLARKQARAVRMATRKTPVAAAVHKVMKVVTFEDLDGDQLIAYKGIHEWWDTAQEIGGIPKPLIIGGYAGTGKSTLLAIALPKLKNLDSSDVRIAYCAYTGKAANGLINKGLTASTVHKLIYNVVDKDDKNGKGGKNLDDDDEMSEVKFELKDRDEIAAELIVVDEASMVPDDMRKDMESLGIPILYTGDHGQLPPVAGKGNIMENPHLKLETIHRQAEDSGIIKIATMVREGKMVENGVYGVNKDAEKVSVSYQEDIPFLASADVIICHTNKLRTKYNKLVRHYKGFHGEVPMVGEKLICVRNNNDTQMFNGMTVTVTSVKEESDVYLIDCIDDAGNTRNRINVSKNYFQGYDHPMRSKNSPVDIFEFAYAITGHKSQGSQWDNVVVIEELMYGQRTSYKKKWMYTVLTRAINKVTWVSRFR